MIYTVLLEEYKEHVSGSYGFFLLWLMNKNDLKTLGLIHEMFVKLCVDLYINA